MAHRFRGNTWDPILLISQIICLQCIFYIASGVLISALQMTFAREQPTLKSLFLDTEVRFGDVSGRCTFIAYLLSPLFSSLAVWRLVKRAKQCLDFACTLYFWHLLFCVLYASHFPQCLLWWVVHFVALVLTTVMGEYLCMRSEMKAIPLAGEQQGQPANSSSRLTIDMTVS